MAMTVQSDFIEVSVAVARQQVAVVEALMEGQGALAVTLSDRDDVPVLEPAVGETPLWPSVVVCGLFDAACPVDQLRRVLSLAPGLEGGAQVTAERLAGRDWVTAWREHFRPMRFGRSLWIIPSGFEAPDPTATLIHLDPGLAFGTGTHPSTQLCLEWIEAIQLTGRSVIDFGCGTGVLGIAAALRGAGPVLCVDNDPQALAATRDNAERNGVAGQIELQAADVFDGRQADVVLANILASTLIDLAPVLGQSVRAGGQLVLAGILEDQADQVMSAYADRFQRVALVAREGWVRLYLQAGAG